MIWDKEWSDNKENDTGHMPWYESQELNKEADKIQNNAHNTNIIH
jgi:hypothetical protein